MCDKLPEGTNLRLLLIRCGCGLEGLTSYASMVDPLVQAVTSCEMTPLTSVGHDFTGAGYSLCILLAESHLVIHTYPECSGSAIAELSVCDHLRSNKERARRLARAVVEIFAPAHLIKEQSQMRPRGTYRAGPGHWGALDVEQLLAQRADRLSLITPTLGEVLLQGDRLVTCTLDEPWVTEPLVHVPLLLHPEPRHVLLAPCGAHPRGHREILRHPSVQRLILVEEGELQRSGQPDARRGDPRLECTDVAPGDYTPPEPVDLVLLDLAGARDLALLERARSWLGPEGIWGVRLPTRSAADGDINNAGNPGTGARHRGRRGLSAGAPPAFYWQHLPSGGRSLFALSGPGFTRLPQRSEWARRLEQRGLGGLQVITADTLEAMFALPPLLAPLVTSFMVSSGHG